ncbi:hypothetical protein [Carboxylicivirga sp. N1Y90]|uniref:hypothetical protein n=1 Tax=Carboxylicivirga fragile TaxID=3417571 RepID=UPI003D337081|nr:hypothetical protein [Marinilabiliaceae bacterium N1Y90]
MKKSLYSLLFLLTMFSVSSYAQCGDDLLKAAIKEMGSSQYIKDFTAELVKESKDGKTGYIKFSFVMQSNSQYKFNVVNGASNADKIILQLKDKDNTRVLASNLYNGKTYDEFSYVCRKAGVYNLVFSFKGGGEGCAKAVLSLEKQL